MERAYKRWVLGLLAGIFLLLTVCGVAVYRVDPCFYYRMSPEREGVFFDERYQSAGIIRNVPADTVLVGTSMAANYRATAISETFNSPSVRITIPDGYLSEFNQVMQAVFREQTPERVVFVLDPNIMVRDEKGVTDAMPEYLYNDSVLDDINYLLNKDTLYYCLYTMMTNTWGGTQTLDEGFTWDKETWWNHVAALNNYKRPELATEPLSANAYEKRTADNLAVVESWISAHPETEFIILFPPYSILFWDKIGRLGQTDAMLSALKQAGMTLLPYENVSLYAFLMDREIVENLDNYCDYVHHSGEVSQMILGKLKAGECQLTMENLTETLANWQEFVVNYPYEQFWEEAFWEQ